MGAGSVKRAGGNKKTRGQKQKIGQIMRDEPLKYVMSVGIRIEKAH